MRGGQAVTRSEGMRSSETRTHHTTHTRAHHTQTQSMRVHLLVCAHATRAHLDDQSSGEVKPSSIESGWGQGQGRIGMGPGSKSPDGDGGEVGGGG